MGFLNVLRREMWTTNLLSFENSLLLQIANRKKLFKCQVDDNQSNPCKITNPSSFNYTIKSTHPLSPSFLFSSHS